MLIRIPRRLKKGRAKHVAKAKQTQCVRRDTRAEGHPADCTRGKECPPPACGMSSLPSHSSAHASKYSSPPLLRRRVEAFLIRALRQ